MIQDFIIALFAVIMFLGVVFNVRPFLCVFAATVYELCVGAFYGDAVMRFMFAIMLLSWCARVGFINERVILARHGLMVRSFMVFIVYNLLFYLAINAVCFIGGVSVGNVLVERIRFSFYIFPFMYYLYYRYYGKFL